jgi:hypothetical protein
VKLCCFEIRMIEAIVNFRIDSIMDRSRSLKRPSDGESSGSSQRQRVEGQTSGGFASGEAGRRHRLFTGTALPSAQSQEIHERHESISLEVPASQQGGTGDLLTLLSQLQETHHQSQAVLEQLQKALEQQGVQMQQQAGSSEMPVSTSHQQDTRALQASLHSPARNEQSLLQHQQEEVFNIDDYVNLASDSDHESDQRDLLQAHGPARRPPHDTGLHDANFASDAQSRAVVRDERFPQPTDARRQQKQARMTQQDVIARDINQLLPVTRKELRAQNDQAQEDSLPSMRPRIDVDPNQYQLHEQQQHDKGKSTMIPELKEYLMQSRAANSATQTYIDTLSKYLSNLSEKEQIEYLKRSRAVDRASAYFSRLSKEDKDEFYRYSTYIKEATEKSKMNMDVAIDVGKKRFPRGYQLSEQYWEEMRRPENISGS